MHTKIQKKFSMKTTCYWVLLQEMYSFNICFMKITQS